VGPFLLDPNLGYAAQAASAASLAARFVSSYVSMTTQVSRPSQAAILYSLLPIFSFRVVGDPQEGERGAALSRVCAPLLYDVSSVPPKVPPTRER